MSTYSAVVSASRYSRTHIWHFNGSIKLTHAWFLSIATKREFVVEQ